MHPDIPRAILMGCGATLVMDLWALVQKRALGVVPLDYCLVGRWLRGMQDGVFRHASIGAAPRRHHECSVGWIAHYATGIAFALVFVLLVPGWQQHPAPVPALLFGVGTVAVPFLVMQPSLGLGIAAARTPDPMQARLRSIVTHAVFGLGLYLSAAVAGSGA